MGMLRRAEQDELVKCGYLILVLILILIDFMMLICYAYLQRKIRLRQAVLGYHDASTLC